MNICVVAYKFGTEQEIGGSLGTYHYFTEKMRRAVRLGHRVFVICPWLTFGHKGSSEVDGVEVVRTWPPMLNVIWAWPFNRIVRRWYQWQTQRAVLALLRLEHIDVLYVWQARETGYAVARIKNELGVPFIFRQITAWKWHFDRPVSEIFGKKRWYQLCTRLHVSPLMDTALTFLLDRDTQRRYAHTIYREAKRVVLLSEAAVREAQEFGLDSSKATVLGVAIEEDQFTPTDRAKADIRAELGLPDAPILLFIGRINFAEKGVGVLLEAFALLRHTMPLAQLVVVGGGELAHAEREIKRLGLGAHTHCVGKKPFHDLPKYINSADVFAVPSLWMEAFGQVTIEAMSCGVPVVTSDAGASPEINLDGETGFVTPAGDAHAMAAAMVKLLQDGELRQRMGEAARKRVQDNYTYEVMVEKFLEICKGV